MADAKNSVECPICGKYLPQNIINTHVNKCLEGSALTGDESGPPGRSMTNDQGMTSSRKRNRTSDTDSDEEGEISTRTSKTRQAKQSKTVSGPLFISKTKVPALDKKGEDFDDYSEAQENILTSTEKPSITITGSKDSKILDSQNSQTETRSSKPKASWSSLGLGKSPPISKTGRESSTRQNSEQKLDMDKSKKDFLYSQPTQSTTGFRSAGKVLSDKQSRTSSFTSDDTIDTKGSKYVNDSYPSNTRTKKDDGHIPLAERMRPATLTNYVGQTKVLGKTTLLHSLINSQKIPSLIIWGPPGCGKTTLARIIARQTKESHNTRFVSLSATTTGIADVKEVIKVAKNEQAMFKKKTILFIDEIHRFNKLQQDTFLPHVEDGTIILIGATTENPSFQVNNALLSRCRTVVLEKLSSDEITLIIERALPVLGVVQIGDGEVVPQRNGVYVRRKALSTLAHLCDGDARMALNSLQVVVESHRGAGTSVIETEHIKEGLQRSHVQYDRAGEEHYNCASALQKSIRGSDDNAAIYWLARMLEGGEDPLFIARRLVVCASEDIGLADPQAMTQAVATFQACHFIGMPECRINLAQCAVYLARAPKSNESYAALDRACRMIKSHKGPLPGVPIHLRNAPTKFMKDLGYGKDYKYPHAYGGYVEQTYLPDELKGTNFFKDS